MEYSTTGIPFFIFFFSAVWLFSIYATIEFIYEKERNAVFRSVIFVSVYTALGLTIYLINYSPLTWVLFLLHLGGTLLLFTPYKKINGIQYLDETIKYDERNTMFSRNELVPSSERYNEYYQTNSQHLEPDTRFRKLPGLLSPNAKYYHPEGFNIAKSNFIAVKQFHPLVSGDVNKVSSNVSPERLSKLVENWACELGALNCSITYLRPHHLYSIKGRGAEYGQRIKTNHQFAITFTTEMDHEMVQAAPYAPIVMESSKQYLRGAKIATLIAQFIRNLGFDARAHIDGNYQVICPLVAKDAGLGEIGRMGILMTPRHGPRVRIGVITTNASLRIGKIKPDSTIEQFCYYCKKCAACCPSKSIPSGKPQETIGGKRWKIDSESCFTYWCKIGTDCGRCMAVCPYSHPDTKFHKFIRWGIRNNYFFLRMAVYLDDFFYGKKPKSKKMPSWLN